MKAGAFPFVLFCRGLGGRRHLWRLRRARGRCDRLGRPRAVFHLLQPRRRAGQQVVAHRHPRCSRMTRGRRPAARARRQRVLEVYLGAEARRLLRLRRLFSGDAVVGVPRDAAPPPSAALPAPCSRRRRRRTTKGRAAARVGAGDAGHGLAVGRRLRLPPALHGRPRARPRRLRSRPSQLPREVTFTARCVDHASRSSSQRATSSCSAPPGGVYRKDARGRRRLPARAPSRDGGR